MKQKFYIYLIISLLIIVVLAWSAIEIFQDSYAIHWQELPILYVLLGALGCLLLIFLAKLIARYLLKRKEDYYD